MIIFIADRFDIAVEQLCGCVDFFVDGGKQLSVDEAPIPGFSKPRSLFKWRDVGIIDELLVIFE